MLSKAEQRMKNKIDINLALLAFDKVMQQGTKSAEGRTLEGLTASTDFDGYTLVLQDKLSSLTIFFHNKYELKGPDNKAIDRLTKNIEYIAKQYD